MSYFTKIGLIFLCALMNLLAYSQSENHHIEPAITHSQADLKSWRAAYAMAIDNSDTSAIYDAAYKLMTYHNGKGTYDSIYYYNEAIISTALAVDEIDIYLNAQIANQFMDSRMNQNEGRAKERLLTIRPYLYLENTSNESKYGIAEIYAGHFYRDGNIDSTIFYQRKALRFSDEIGEQHGQRATANVQLAIYLELVGRSAEAIQYLTKIESSMESGTHPPIQRMYFFKTMSNTLLSIGDVDKAQYYLEQVKSIVDENGYKTVDSEIFKQRAKIASVKGAHKEAIRHYLSSLASLKKNGIKQLKPTLWANLSNEYYKVDDLENMKRYLDSLSFHYDDIVERNKVNFHGLNIKYQLRKGNFQQAKTSLEYVNSYNKKPNPEQLYIANLNYLYFDKIGNLPEAFKAFKRHTTLKDSLNEVANVALTTRTEATYNREKQDLKILGLTQTTAAQDRALAIRNNALMMGTIMLLILAGLFYMLYKLHQKNQAQTVKITKALEDNQMLIKEIHHRVKNNLQVISSLLSMQERKVDDQTTKEALRSSKSRVQTMSLIHKSLYQEDDVRSVDIKSYFQQLTENLVASFAIHPVELKMDIDPLQIDVDSLAPLGLVANELICNALKHGIHDKENGVLSVSIKEKGEHIVLTVEDNGGKLKSDKLERKDGSLGIRLIEAFSRNLQGEIKVSAGTTSKVSLIIDKNKINLLDQ